MKYIDKIIILVSLIYVLLYKIFLFNINNIFVYIVNPIVWIVLAIITYITLYHKSNTKFPYLKEVMIVTLIISIIYVVTFYFFGIYIDFHRNPYSVTGSGIIINIFSIMLVILLQEFMRSILINLNQKYKYIHCILIFILFFIYEVNFNTLTTAFNSIDNFFNAFGKELMTLIGLNIFMIYLSKNGSYKAPFIYRLIVTLPSLTIYIIPNYPWLVQLLFNLIFPLFIYLTIKYIISKKSRNAPIRLIDKLDPKKWLLPFALLIILVLFALGMFSIKPLVVLSPSMVPTFNKGDLVIIESCEIEDVKEGDIVEYQLDNISIIHRVIKINNYNEIELITKGDNNQSKDRKPVKKEQLIGKYKFHIPYIGYPTYILYKLLGNNKGEEINK